MAVDRHESQHVLIVVNLRLWAMWDDRGCHRVS